MTRIGALIGDVARQTGLSIHAIRFYEAKGLLHEPPRTEAGYRVFSPETIEQLQFIQKAHALGFTLNEIRELLVLKDRRTNPCSHLKSIVEEKLVNVQAKVRELAGMEKELKRVLGQCNRQLKRHARGTGERCPVLAKLGRSG